jgi:hypothetical protein
MSDIPIPVEYRADVIAQLFDLLRAGESCALVGVGSSGKSNIARHMERADVRQHYLGEDAAYTVILRLNCKPYAQRPLPDFYLYILDELDPVLQELHGPFGAIRPDIANLNREAQVHPEQLALRRLDRALSLIVRAGAKNVIVILDDCDQLFVEGSAVLFSDLRGLRDNYKGILAYLTLTRREPVFLRTDVREYEELFELISPPGHTWPLRPYQMVDGINMVKRLGARQNPARMLSEAAALRLYKLGGGHAGLMRSLFFLTQSKTGVLPPESPEGMAAEADVRGECRKILDSLEEEERLDLFRIINGVLPSPEGEYRLERRGLIKPRSASHQLPELFSPVFAQALIYLEAEMAGEGVPPPAEPQPLNQALIEFIEFGHHVRVNGHLITSLTPAEHALLRRLADRRPHACTRAELLEVMLDMEHTQDHKLHGRPDRRFMQAIDQLQLKLGTAGPIIQAERDQFRLVG